MLKVLLRTLVWLLCIVAAIPAVVVAMLYFYAINETHATGFHYGFQIGESKADVYRRAKELRADSAISGLEASVTREIEESLHPGAGELVDLEALRERFFDYSHWSLWRLQSDGEPPFGILNFDGDQLVNAGPPGGVALQWVPQGAPEALRFEAGQSYKTVYELLEELSRAPGYESLMFRSGWMARRMPKAFSEDEFALIEPYDRWLVFYGQEPSHLDLVELRFDQGQLVEIHRHRQLIELP